LCLGCGRGGREGSGSNGMIDGLKHRPLGWFSGRGRGVRAGHEGAHLDGFWALLEAGGDGQDGNSYSDGKIEGRLLS
jgi:hypothetical protein